jgi:hypothetical protein
MNDEVVKIAMKGDSGAIFARPSPDNQPRHKSLENIFSGACPMWSGKVLHQPPRLVLPRIRHNLVIFQCHLGSSVQCWAMKLNGWQTIEPASVLVSVFYVSPALFIFLFSLSL